MVEFEVVLDLCVVILSYIEKAECLCLGSRGIVEVKLKSCVF